MKKNSIIGLIVIVLIGGILGLVVLSALNNGTAKVIVPATEIKAGETFTSENLKTIDMPKKAIIEGVTVTNTESILGKIAVSKIAENEMISMSRIAETEGNSLITNMEKPKENYVIEIPISEINAVSNISVGDYISIMVSITSEIDNDITTGRIGDKYRVVGIIENENMAITGVKIEVKPSELAKVSHVILNNKILIASVSGKQEVTTTPGINQTTLIPELTK